MPSGRILTFGTRAATRHARASGHPARPTPIVWLWTPAFAAVKKSAAERHRQALHRLRRVLRDAPEGAPQHEGKGLIKPVFDFFTTASAGVTEDGATGVIRAAEDRVYRLP